MGNCFARRRKLKKSLDSKVTKADGLHSPFHFKEHLRLPEFKPSWRRRADIIPDPKIFQAVDRHAIQTPTTVQICVSVLALYLSQPFRTDLEKIRAFYRWITENISYSIDQFYSDRIERCDAEAVLKRGSTVCQGYAELFQAFCSQVRIPCRIITGFAKDFTYDPNVPFTPKSRTNHAWNLVNIEGVWRHVECTWGAGYISGKSFVKCFEEIYFLTDPEDFVQAHFPYMNGNMKDSARYQLLRKPWNLATFNRRVKIFSTGLDYGLRTLSHSDWRINVSKEVVIRVQAQKLKGMMADLLLEGVELPGHAVVRLDDDGVFSVTVRPPTPGRFELCLLGRDRVASTIYCSMVNYVIVCSEAIPNLHPYPKHRRTQYGAVLFAEEYGLASGVRTKDFYVSKAGTLDIHLPLTGPMPAMFGLIYAEADLPNLDSFVMATYADASMHVLVRLPRVGFYELTVLAKKPGEETHKYDPVLYLLLESLRACQDCQPFPAVLGAAADMGVTLVEPLALYLPPDQQVKMQLTSRLLKRVMPDSLQQEGDTWRGLVSTGESGSRLVIFGSKEDSGPMKSLIQFEVQ